MQKYLRLNEYKAALYRISLAYVFYFIARVLFYIYNIELVKVDSLPDFLSLWYYGLAFDTTAILYINIPFILFSLLPLRANTNPSFQKFLFYLYFISNLLFYATNFIDFIYYKYTFTRSTIVVVDVIKNETNLSVLFLGFLFSYWHTLLLFIVCSAVWIFLYKKVVVVHTQTINRIPYFSVSILFCMLTALLIVDGIRGGDFKKATRPINIMDACRHVKNISHSDIVLNTPFAILRTLFKHSFHKINYPDVNEQVIREKVQPIKEYHNHEASKPNVVVFILESFGREYIGAFNKKSTIPNYKSHTPFLDSLSQYSLIFTNAYANGRQSIHGMSSVIAGIPSFKDAFTSSPYPKQKIESLVSTLESEGYNTSFFHGAANGSMGFLGFSAILGFDNYYGRTEFNDDSQYDGVWGIWDEPFLQFMKKTLDKKKMPFFASVFTVSSHEPYKVPEKYKSRFLEGDIPIHKCIEYSDFALARFFAEAKKSKWFSNTIFIFVADHCNWVHYDEYQKAINHYAVPIIIYQPGSNYVGIDEDLAQQIDIYPTILDMIGYKKPFRSWGRSLLDKKSAQPFVINSTGTIYQFSKGDYICTFDGKNVIGFYDKDDKALSNNLIQNRNAAMSEIELNCKAFIQDYMNRVINKKLYTNNQ